MKYEVFEHVSDLGLVIYGSSLEELLENAGLALFEQITELSRVRAEEVVELIAEGDTVEDLFVSWLRELLYMFHGGRYLLKEFRVSEIRNNRITASARGERMDMKRHVMEREIKAATYHNLEVREIDGGWRARVILDV